MKRWSAKNLTSDTFKAGIGVVSLVCLLAYTWMHTSELLARYVNPDAFGYAAAAGIELAIVSLSLRIGQERKQGRSAAGFYAVLVSVLVVSAFANIAEGYATMFGQLLTAANIAQVDWIQAIVGIAATGLLSVIVLALSDIIGGDVRKAAQASERMERKAAKDAEPTTQDETQQTQVASVVALPLRYQCDKCGATFAKSQQYAAHRRYGCAHKTKAAHA